MINLSYDIIGNNNLSENLITKFNNKQLSNSIILSGQKGIGKATFAFNFISKIFKTIDYNKSNCDNLIYNNTHPNIKYLSKLYDDKTNKYKQYILIDQIRDIENFLNQSTFNNLPKFIIIDSADDLNNNSANSLLKSLEEPKKNTYFILITHQISNLLPTIKSRCINYKIDNLTYAQFLNILEINDIKTNLSDNNFLYYLTNGSAGLAIKIYSEKLTENYNSIIKIFLANPLDTENINNLTNEVNKYTNDEFKNFLILLRFIILSVIKINLGHVFYDDLSSDSIKYLKKISNFISNSKLLEILDFLNENEKDLFIYNLDKKIFCFNIFSPLIK